MPSTDSPASIVTEELTLSLLAACQQLILGPHDLWTKSFANKIKRLFRNLDVRGTALIASHNQNSTCVLVFDRLGNRRSHRNTDAVLMVAHITDDLRFHIDGHILATYSYHHYNCDSTHVHDLDRWWTSMCVVTARQFGDYFGALYPDLNGLSGRDVHTPDQPIKFRVRRSAVVTAT
jgi:hypothetical protein